MCCISCHFLTSCATSVILQPSILHHKLNEQWTIFFWFIFTLHLMRNSSSIISWKTIGRGRLRTGWSTTHQHVEVCLTKVSEWQDFFTLLATVLTIFCIFFIFFIIKLKNNQSLSEFHGPSNTKSVPISWNDALLQWENTIDFYL